MVDVPAGTLTLEVDGQVVQVPDDGSSLLEVLRQRLGARSPKDGCSPQGQCGCCTVWVDGQPRVACVTAARRVAGRRVTTLAGVPDAQRARWVQAFVDRGASQCGFCTPGILMRLMALERLPGPVGPERVEQALAAHLCRCTGWRSIVAAALDVLEGATAAGATRDLGAAARRAALEGQASQVVGPAVVRGEAGFADDRAPAEALVALPRAEGDWRDPDQWVVAETLAEARRLAGHRPGRSSTLPVRPPLALPPGDWALRLQTSFVDPAYLEPDCSWCEPGGDPADPLANGGAFGGKAHSPVRDVARLLAERAGRPVKAVATREDLARRGPKRPPVALGVDRQGRGRVRVARTPGAELAGWAEAFRSAGLAWEIEEVEVPGPPVAAALRAAGWAEAAVVGAVLAALDRGQCPGASEAVTEVRTPEGAVAQVRLVAPQGPAERETVEVTVQAGEVLDETTLRSYCLGAVHQGLGWVRREGLAVDEAGEVHDLTVRSFGVLPARATPEVRVTLAPPVGPPRAASDAVLAATAAAAWLVAGLPPAWPIERVPNADPVEGGR
ncbi:2Fe-2S iron-sulfur cluster-binding protein [Aciditerrimonas ferrireducens]|uniref:2Fe-2S iron-sulfur cluster-binding protein n=1 Tax=Aciditerrimonas ferrireducens TaxID=667306 RepID=UPI0020049174|nr:2Fe-2S iron-sulfur cluster-binding protein [Aciditerrimonas ferrireducens]MCK4176806.1 2Fe-2S iron-sulfur cluster-binding protein [Aciditerrimonas ferrireducens]